MSHWLSTTPSVFPQDLTEAEVKGTLQHVALPVRVIVPKDISATLFQLRYQKNAVAKPVADWVRSGPEFAGLAENQGDSQ
jgi:hypothetical protein